MLRGLFLSAVAAFSAFAAFSAPTLVGALFLLAMSLAAIVGLLQHVARSPLGARPSGRALAPTGAGRPLPAATASPLEQAEARVGQPIQVLCPFELRAQDRPGERGGVWDALPRQELHILSTGALHRHDVELSWPLIPRLLIATLTGPAADRERLLGLLAADELGVRDLLDPPATDARGATAETVRA